MEVLRRPIYSKQMKVIGYELLFSEGIEMLLKDIKEKSDSNIINNAYLNIKIEDISLKSKAFIEFSEEQILKGLPLIFNNNTVVVISKSINNTSQLISVCKKLKKLGYTLVLDSFSFQQKQLELMQMVDIIKIEYGSIGLESQKKLIKALGKTKFMATNISTVDQFNSSRNIGFDFFEGSIFGNSATIKLTDNKELNPNLIKVIIEANRRDIDFKIIAELLESDKELAAKIIRISNYPKYGSKYEITSIKHALPILGLEELKKWLYVLVFKDIKDRYNNTLIKNSLIRAKQMELLASENSSTILEGDFFITGLLSLIDKILNKDMKDIISQINTSKTVEDALLNKANDINTTLNYIKRYEKAGIESLSIDKNYGVTKSRFVELYFKALRWTEEVGV